MKINLKTWLPAIALSLFISGTFVANARSSKMNHSAKETTYLGIRQNQQEVPLDEEPTSDDCAKQVEPICYYILDGTNPPVPVFDGPYIGSGQ